MLGANNVGKTVLCSSFLSSEHIKLKNNNSGRELQDYLDKMSLFNVGKLLEKKIPGHSILCSNLCLLTVTILDLLSIASLSGC